MTENNKETTPRRGRLTFGDLEALVSEGKKNGMSSSDPVMFIHEEKGRPTTMFDINKARVEPMTYTEGACDSCGGTLWLHGTEY